MDKRNEYHVSQEDGALYTVVRWDADGVSYDLNAEGEPCTTKAELVEFIYALCEQGAFDEVVREQLLREAIA